MASNMLKIYEKEFKGLTKEEHMDKVYGVTGMMISGFMQSGLDQRILSDLFVAMTSVSVLSDKNKMISAKEKELINKIFKSMVSDMEVLYKDISVSNASDFDLIRKVVSVVRNDLAIYMLLYMLGFASIDGEVETEFEKKMDEIFGMHFLSAFFDSGLESVPSIDEEIYGFEREIIEYFKKNGGILPLKKICKHFKNKPENEIKEVLDSLAERGILSDGNQFFDCTYALLEDCD